MLHSKSHVASLHVNETIASRCFVGVLGCAVIVTIGGVASIVHIIVTTSLTLPAASVARTANVCGPSASVGVVAGDAHGANGPSSNEHSNTQVASSQWNSN